MLRIKKIHIVSARLRAHGRFGAVERGPHARGSRVYRRLGCVNCLGLWAGERERERERVQKGVYFFEVVEKKSVLRVASGWVTS